MTGAVLIVDDSKPYDAMASALHARGLRLDSLHEALLAQEIPSQEAAILNQYRNEVAREYISNCGRANSVDRVFPEPVGYRSRFLDEVAASWSAGRKRLAALAGLDAAMYGLFNPDTVVRFAEKLESAKKAELPQVSERAYPPVVKNSDKFTLLSAVARDFGFETKRKAITKIVSNLCLSVHVDGGGRFGLNSQLLIALSATRSDTQFGFILNMDQIVPAVHYYNIFRTSEEAALGVVANTVMISVVVKQLEAGSIRVGA